MTRSTLLVLCHLASHWHSGQWSRGYRLLCMTMTALARRGIRHPLDIPLNPMQQQHYDLLQQRYAAKL